MTLAATAASPVADENSEVIAAQPGAEAAADANPAASSTVDEDANQPVDLLSVMKSAVEPAAEPAASSTAEGEEGKPAGEADTGTENAAVADETDDAKLPFHNHPRWK